MRCAGSRPPEHRPAWRVRVAHQQRDALAKAVLMFHSVSPWTAEKRFEWQALTGTEEATMRTLCDFARRCLEQ